MSQRLKEALEHPLWKQHELGKEYLMINRDQSKDPGWKIAYYPIFEDGKTGQEYDEPRALVEKPFLAPDGTQSNDLREMPLRYLETV